MMSSVDVPQNPEFLLKALKSNEHGAPPRPSTLTWYTTSKLSFKVAADREPKYSRKISMKVCRNANPNRGSTFASMHIESHSGKARGAPFPLMGHRIRTSAHWTWQQALGVSPMSKADIYKTGSTSPGRVALATALLTASIWSRGYAGDVDLNPDCMIDRLQDVDQTFSLHNPQ